MAALLAACGDGDSEPTNDPTTPAAQEASSAELPTTEPEPETTESGDAGDADADKGSSDGADSTEEFAKLVAGAMQSVKTMKSTSDGDLLGHTVTQVDLSDRANLVMYSLTEIGGVKTEVAVVGSDFYTRSAGGDWVKTEQNAGIKEQIERTLEAGNAEHMAARYASVTLLDAGERKYELQLAGANDAPTVTVWLDDENRIGKQELALASDTMTSVIEYNVPLDIPALPGR